MAKFTLDENDLDHLLGTGDDENKKLTSRAGGMSFGAPVRPNVPAAREIPSTAPEIGNPHVPATPPMLGATPQPMNPKYPLNHTTDTRPIINTLEGNKRQAAPLEIPAAPEISASPALTPPLLGAPAEIPKAPTAKESIAAGMAQHGTSANQEGKRQFEEMRPQVTALPGTPEYGQQKQQQLDYDNQHHWGGAISAHPGTLGEIGHVLGKIGNIAGNIVMPSTMALIPGTQLHNEMVAKGNENWIKSGEENQLKEAQAGEARGREWASLHPGAGKTAEEQAFASQARINAGIGTAQDEANVKAFSQTKQAEQDVKPEDEAKQPIGEKFVPQHVSQLKTLEVGMSPQESQAFEQAYGVTPTDTHAVSTKRLEDAKAAAALSAGERDRALQRGIAERNHQDQQNNLNENRGLTSVQYKDKNGNMVSGSYNDALAAGAEASARKISAEDDKNNRMVYAQFSRWQENIGNAASTMGAWDNAKDKELAIRALHDIENSWSVGAFHTGADINASALESAFLRSGNFNDMTPAGQQHMQNMFQLWSDAINLMKTETGGVPRGEHFLKLESNILPQPEKTQAQNREALNAFSQRIMHDTKGHVRPNDMENPVPYDAQGVIKNKEGQTVGYVDANGKRQSF